MSISYLKVSFINVSHTHKITKANKQKNDIVDCIGSFEIITEYSVTLFLCQCMHSFSFFFFFFKQSWSSVKLILFMEWINPQGSVPFQQDLLYKSSTLYKIGCFLFSYHILALYLSLFLIILPSPK